MKRFFLLSFLACLFFGTTNIPSTHAAAGDGCTLDADCVTADAPYCNPSSQSCTPRPTSTPTPQSKEYVPLVEIPGLNDNLPEGSAGLAKFFNNLYVFLIGIAAVLAVIMIIWAGIEIALNRDNVSEIMSSKGKIYNAIFGLVLVLSPALVFSIINPSILNLSLNIPKLDLPKPQSSAPTVRQSSGWVHQNIWECDGGNCTQAKEKAVFECEKKDSKLTSQPRCAVFPTNPQDKVIVSRVNAQGTCDSGKTLVIACEGVVIPIDMQLR